LRKAFYAANRRKLVATTLTVFAVLYFGRVIGAPKTAGDILAIVAHTAIFSAIGYAGQTASFVLVEYAVRSPSPRMVAATAGFLVASFAASALSIWLVLWVGADPYYATDPLRLWSLSDWQTSIYPSLVLMEGVLATMIWLAVLYATPPPQQADVVPPPSDATGAGLSSQPSEPEQPPFLKRLSHARAGKLWALSSERHYVRVYTSSGDELLLMRLSDAMDQCAGLDGIQVHRSHWVHRCAVSAHLHGQGRSEVLLRNGVRIPVSRSNYAALRRFLGE